MLNSEYLYQEYIRREEHILRAPYNPELEFYSSIKAGDVNKVKELCESNFSAKEGLGNLSDDPLQSLRYHLVITIAMVARYCIEGGLDVSTSYGLSDFYIKKTDKARTAAEISELHKAICLDYTKRMRNLRKEKITSRPVLRCIDYINDHLHVKISLASLAEHVGVTDSYLSRLFKKETGMTVSNYIQNTRIETAKNMLIYSDYSPAEIANILAFSDQSYFTEVFHKATGTTPRMYQSMHLRETELS